MAEVDSAPVEPTGTSSPPDAASDDISAADVLSSMGMGPGASAPDPEPEPELPPSPTPEAASSAPQPDTAAPSREPGATTPPAESAVDATSEATPSGEAAPGPIPFERHKAILERARSEAEQRAHQALVQQLGLDPAKAGEAAKLYQWLEQDPGGFAQWLSSKVQPAEPAGPIEPALKSADGIAAYSAEQVAQLLDERTQAILQQVQDQLGPVTQHVQQAQHQAFLADGQSRAQRIIQQAKAEWPLFTELQMPMRDLMQANPNLSFEGAYIQAFRQQGQAKLHEQWRAKQTEVLAEKAAAGHERPGREPETPRDRASLSIEELIDLELEKAGIRD